MKRITLAALFGLAVVVACNPAECLGQTSPASGSRAARPTVTAAPAVCDTDDCINVARASVEWVLAKVSYAPSDLLRDTARTGVQRAQSEAAARGFPLARLQQLTAATGIGAGSSADLDCSARPVLGNNAHCRLRHGRALVSLQAPEFNVIDFS